MADQITPTGGLAPGLQLAFMAATKAQQVKESPRPAKIADARPQAPVERRPDPSAPSLESAAKEVQHHVQQVATELRFLVDDQSGKAYFKVVNESTGEVIFQVPSEEVLAAARKLRQLANPKGASGVLVDKEG